MTESLRRGTGSKAKQCARILGEHMWLCARCWKVANLAKPKELYKKTLRMLHSDRLLSARAFWKAHFLLVDENRVKFAL